MALPSARRLYLGLLLQSGPFDRPTDPRRMAGNKDRPKGPPALPFRELPFRAPAACGTARGGVLGQSRLTGTTLDSADPTRRPRTPGRKFSVTSGSAGKMDAPK